MLRSFKKNILTSGSIWLFVPETKNLTLEEMDILFGSVGTAEADKERMREVNREVGLEEIVRGGSVGYAEKQEVLPEKNEISV